MIYRFGEFTLDSERLELRCGEELRATEPQVFSLLAYLIDKRDRVVSKDELIDAVWNGRIVSDSTLTTRINALRRAEDDDGKAQAVIRTFVRRGFRFVADVRESSRPDLRQHATTSSARGADPFLPKAELTLPDKPSIAVLPFDNMSGDHDQAYFADGIAKEIITALSKFGWFFVTARNSTFSYKGRSVEVRQIGKELGVRYVLEGSVRKAGERVRVTVQLIDATPGNHIWAERYDREIGDVFALQDEITETVTATITPQLLVAESERAKRKPPESMQAWELVMRAIPLIWRLNGLDLAKAQQLLRDAVERDPGYAEAHGYSALLTF